jgi:DNA-binding CsgD family transcriptional regulator
MVVDGPLVGRVRELAVLTTALAAVKDGRGGLLLLAGEAGVGKTRLVDEALSTASVVVLRGEAAVEGSVPYGPVIAALRSGLRDTPGLLGGAPLTGHLARLLPELGPPAAESDRATLFEALRWAFATICRPAPIVVFLDDLHWADNATLELLPALAGTLEREPLLLLGAYRSDEIPRGHALRRARTDLRRLRRLRELAVGPLDRADTAALAARLLGGAVSPALAATLHDRTAGVPFFVEELAAALAAGGRLRVGDGGLDLAPGDELPIPDTVRDAVLLRAESLSGHARDAIEVAAVAGLMVDLDLVRELAGDEAGVAEAIERGLLADAGAGRAGFRHALIREALYDDITWTRKRAIHRRLGQCLEARGAPPALLAEHWLAAREMDRARTALAAATDASCRVHAYRDALVAARRALELWPEGVDEPLRLQVLERLGHCAQLSGDLAGSAVAWREVAEARKQAGDQTVSAEAQRRIAGVYELQGSWERALAARQAAAEGFDAGGLPGEAAAERLAAALHLWSTGNFAAALALGSAARAGAEQAGRIDLRARLLGLEGIVGVSEGRHEQGLAAIHAGLALALDHNLVNVTAELYQRLAVAQEHGGDYAGAGETFAAGITFCEERGEAATAQFCLACLGVLFHQTGEWDRAVELWRGMLVHDPPPRTRVICLAGLGVLCAQRGDVKQARALLAEADALGQRLEHLPTEIYTRSGLVQVEALAGAHEAVAERWRALIARWERSEDRHYILAPLQWAATYFAERGIGAEVRACAAVLARIAAETGNREAVATLAHALGEARLIDGDAHGALAHFDQALAGWRELGLLPLRARTLPRAAAALLAAGEPAMAAERLADAYRIARRLGARPLVQQISSALTRLEVGGARPLIRRLVGETARGGLSRRELEILRLVASGHTNREIARNLYLSIRTVDMHVRHILDKLDCRSRAEATHRAGELGLLAEESPVVEPAT